MWTDLPAHVEVELEMRRKGEASGEADETVARRRVAASLEAGSTWYTFEFAPLATAKNRTFLAVFRVTRFDVPATPEAIRPSVGLMAWADDALPGGRLYVGSRERWGDLVFVVRSEPATRLERLSEALEALLPVRVAPWALVVVGLIYWVIVVGVVAVAMARVTTARDDAATASTAGARARWPGLVVAVVIAAGIPVLAGFAFTARERVAIDLLHDIDRATLESPEGLHNAFSVMEENINGYKPKAIFAHPPSRITWDVTVPMHAPAVKTGVALQPYMWSQANDGVNFRISVQEDADVRQVYSRYVHPTQRTEDRAWIDVRVDLSEYAGRAIKLHFETDGGPAKDFAFDWAMWAHPRIVER
jgi:hypothetical protein